MRKPEWIIKDRQAVARLRYQIRQFLHQIKPLRISSDEMSKITEATECLEKTLNSVKE